MNKLEKLVIEFLQKCLTNDEVEKKERTSTYVMLENELLLLTRTLDTDMYIITDCNLQNMGTDLFSLEKITDTTYRVKWKDLFYYLVGAKDIDSIDRNLVTNETRMLRLSPKPLTNYLKTK